jgi:Mor family transcriptional regulator
MGANHWSEEKWLRLVEQWCADFGPDLAARIIQSTVAAVGGERLTIPSLQDLQTRERDRRICNYHRGDCAETSARFDVSVATVRRVLLRQKMIDRSRMDAQK